MKNYELIIFDWDGTLMNSMVRIVDSVRAVAQSQGLAPPSYDRIYAQVGLKVDAIFSNLFPNLSKADCAALIEDYKAHFMWPNVTDDFLYQGVKETLRDLDREGYLLAIATSKGRKGLNKVFKELEIEDYFVMTCSADDALSKPNPDMLLQILEFTGKTPGKALMIGDSMVDIQMAQAASVDVIAVSSGTHSAEELLCYNPIICLDDVTHLIHWLERQKND